MTIFSDTIDALFTDDDMAVDGVYTPASGVPVAVRVIMAREEDGAGFFSTGAVVGRQVAEIRTSELRNAAEGDALTIGSDIAFNSACYLVASVERRDSGRYIWSLSLTEV